MLRPRRSVATRASRQLLRVGPSTLPGRAHHLAGVGIRGACRNGSARPPSPAGARQPTRWTPTTWKAPPPPLAGSAAATWPGQQLRQATPPPAPEVPALGRARWRPPSPKDPAARSGERPEPRYRCEAITVLLLFV